jgi:tankyrase
LLIKYKANVNAKDNWSWTPLHEACLKSKLDVILVLIQNGADLKIKNLDGKTPLDLNSTNENVRALLSGEYRKNEILEAARSGQEDILIQLLTPLNVNCHVSDGRKSTPLHLASGFNRTQIVKLLLDRGADVHAKDKGGLIALHNACSYGHYEVAKLLIEYGADPNACDMWAFTPLHEAIIKNRPDVCTLLLSHKAQPYLLNCYKQNSFELAAEQKQNPDLLDRIIFDYLGYTLLDAVAEENLSKVKYLLNSNVIEEIKKNLKNDIVTDYLNRVSNEKANHVDAYSKRLANFKHCRTLKTPLVSRIYKSYLKKSRTNFKTIHSILPFV